MNLLQGDLDSDAWLVLSREFDKVVIIASYAEAVYKMKLEVFFQVTDKYRLCCCLLANQSDAFLGNLLPFDSILNTVEWELFCEMLS